MDQYLVTSEASLARRRSTPRSIRGALGEIDGLAASLADVGLVEFIRKDFFFNTAFRTLACEGR